MRDFNFNIMNVSIPTPSKYRVYILPLTFEFAICTHIFRTSPFYVYTTTGIKSLIFTELSDLIFQTICF